MNIFVIENQAYESAEEAINAMANLTTKRADIYEAPSAEAWDEAKEEGWNPYEYFTRIGSKSLAQIAN